MQRLQWFSRGFYAVSLRDSAVVISDLRMGIEPDYVFQFKVGTLSNSRVESAMPQLLPVNRDLSGLSAVWRRIWNQSVELGGR